MIIREMKISEIYTNNLKMGVHLCACNFRAA